MPRFSPFPAARYDTSRLDLSTVTSPPYDVIDDVERAGLAARDPANAVHIDLPVETDQLDRYQAARAQLDEWLDSGVLVRETAPAFYGYRMSFVDAAGRTHRSTGVFGALELSGPGEGHLLPHEHTTPKARSDRLDLLRACEANLSAIWGLSPSVGLTAAIGEPEPDAHTWSDDDGIDHTMWVIRDPDQMGAISAAVQANPVVIADGHHRYETSLQYRDERRAASSDGSAGDAEAAMFLVVELVADELVVLPIHRLINGLDTVDGLADRLAAWFEVGEDVDPTPTLLDQMIELGHLVLVEPGRLRALHPRPGAFDHVRDLDTVRLDTALAGIGEVELSYQHGIDNVVRAVEDRAAQAGVLVRPVTVDQIAATADGGERMPPKTTFFHPKPRTGVVFRVLDR
ncbi:MAG: DUF1015 family protein [Acidimicrobiales bacterium]